MYNIHLLPATFGDSILIEYGSATHARYILIDGGPYYNFDELWTAMQEVAPGITEIELLVVTHIDIDHIDGIVKMLNQTNLPFAIKDIWFNGRKELEAAAAFVESDTLGSLQGEYLSLLIKEKGFAHNKAFNKKPVCIYDYDKPLPVKTLSGGMKITLLSPDVRDLDKLIPVWDKELKDRDIEEEWENDTRYADTLGDHVDDLMDATYDPDDSEANCSSIAFICTYEGKSCLFAADAPSHVLLRSVQPLIDSRGDDVLEVDAWKLAHHGSKKSTQDSIMKLVKSPRILISSDGKRYHHPDEVVIAKIFKYKNDDITFYFNYKTRYNSMWDKQSLRDEYGYETIYPGEGEDGITITL